MPISFTQPTLLAVVFLASLGSAAGAQSPATSFGQLRALVKAGDVVTVTDNAGDIVKGRIVDVSPNRLTIVDGRLRDFAVADVRRIAQQRHASLGKGAAWGAGFGAGMALLMSGYDFSSYRAPYAYVIGLKFGALGAAAGAGLAAATIGEHVIFANPANGTNLTLTPLVDRERRGVRMSVRF